MSIVPAGHAPVAHWLGSPCIFLMPRPRWHRYPLVHERNVLPLLVHESIHCTMQRRGLEQHDAWFDAEFPDTAASRELVGGRL